MNTFLRLFGSGPVGVILTVGLLCFARWLHGQYAFSSLGLTSHVRYTILCLAVAGNLAGVVWSLRSLPVSQRGRDLCTQGAYRWVRHPLYASFLSIGAPGLAIFFNHWIDLFWVAVLHLLWHRVVVIEERAMAVQFGRAYLDYASRTGRFVPRFYG